MLVIKFYNMITDEYEGEGYYMPDVETFKNYASNELGAVQIDINKYKHPRRNSYISLEERDGL